MAGDLLAGDLVRHADHGCGRVERTSGFGEGQNCSVYFSRMEQELWCARTQLVKLAAEESTAYELFRLAVRELRSEESPQVELGKRWSGGELILQPGDESAATKSVPIEAFFHKIVMVRDRLRVLEQQINAHKALSEQDKVGLQQYITRSYGSLTTFNALFQDKEDHFVGQKGGK